jgi:protein gp37
MGEKTKIPWCHHTFNPWWGCTKVSPGCEHCYAERLAVRYGFQLWGTDAPRRTFSEKHWREPLKWNADAEKAGERRRVFCGSMCDLFENRAELDGILANVLRLIHRTPQLDWLLLTKRPELFEARMSAAAFFGGENGELAKRWAGGAAIPNVWMLTTVESQEVAGPRIEALLKIPAKVHGISLEPLLGPVKLCNCHAELTPVCWHTPECPLYAGGGIVEAPRNLDWLIIGCESGPRRRRCVETWVRGVVFQGHRTGLAVFVKQLEINGRVEADPRRWPEDLRIQEFPFVTKG